MILQLGPTTGTQGQAPKSVQSLGAGGLYLVWRTLKYERNKEVLQIFCLFCLSMAYGG